MEKLTVKVEVSENRNTFNISLGDLGHTEETWNELSGDKQHDCIQEYIDEQPDQPYWIVTSY